MSLPAISRHLRILAEAGLIERRSEAQRRRCSLRGEGLCAAADWIDFYRRFWGVRLDQLDDFLNGSHPTSNKGKRYDRRR